MRRWDWPINNTHNHVILDGDSHNRYCHQYDVCDVHNIDGYARSRCLCISVYDRAWVRAHIFEFFGMQS
jgi:hypothetical protein